MVFYGFYSVIIVSWKIPTHINTVHFINVLPDSSNRTKYLFHSNCSTLIIIIKPNYSKIIPSHKTSIENLYLANTTQIYPEDRGTNYSVRMAIDIANLINNWYRKSDEKKL